MVKFIEVVQTFKNVYALREVFINPSHVVYLREDISMKTKLTEGQLPDDMDLRQSFTRIQIHNGTNGSEFILVGTPAVVESKLNGEKRELLNG